MLLEYLVRSKAQRAVLRALVGHKEGLTVREVSLRAKVPYSNAYGEVTALRDARLLKVLRVGNASLHTWDNTNPHVAVLKRLLTPQPSPQATDPDEVTLWNLRRWRAPLVRKGERGTALSLEETLVEGAFLARRDPHVFEVWPVVLGKNKKDLDLLTLQLKTRRRGARKVVGFLLALSGNLLEDASLTESAERLRDRRFRRMEDFSLLPKGPRLRRLTEMRTPDLARSWCFRVNMTLDSSRAFVKKHMRTS